MPRTRTFIAVDVGSAIRTAIVEAQKTLSNTGAHVNWVSPESMHVTLLFLGEVDDTDLARICRVTQKSAVGVEPFLLRIGGLGAFPNPRRPKTIWGGLTEGADSLQRLHAKIEEQLIELGTYRQEERAYTPHLTLGRVQGEADGNILAEELPKWEQWNGGYTTIEEVLVMSSELLRSGPEYTVVGRAPLGE